MGEITSNKDKKTCSYCDALAIWTLPHNRIYMCDAHNREFQDEQETLHVELARKIAMAVYRGNPLETFHRLNNSKG